MTVHLTESYTTNIFPIIIVLEKQNTYENDRKELL